MEEALAGIGREPARRRARRHRPAGHVGHRGHQAAPASVIPICRSCSRSTTTTRGFSTRSARAPRGYLLKKTPPARLIESLQEAVAGGAPMSPEVARRVIALFREIPPARHADYDLTPHETRLLEHDCRGPQLQDRRGRAGRPCTRSRSTCAASTRSCRCTRNRTPSPRPSGIGSFRAVFNCVSGSACRGRACPCPVYDHEPRAGTSPAPTLYREPP